MTIALYPNLNNEDFAGTSLCRFQSVENCVSAQPLIQVLYDLSGLQILRTNPMRTKQLEYTSTSCKYSACKRHRYLLSRSWQQGTGRVVFVGLNPSTADATSDDPTIRRCVDYAVRWGFAHMDMVNLFSFRATQPTLLFASLTPVGPRNDSWLAKTIVRSDLALACWGNHGSHLNRSTLINARYPQLHCLKITAQNQPAHPLYLSASLLPKQY